MSEDPRARLISDHAEALRALSRAQVTPPEPDEYGGEVFGFFTTEDGRQAVSALAAIKGLRVLIVDCDKSAQLRASDRAGRTRLIDLIEKMECAALG